MNSSSKSKPKQSAARRVRSVAKYVSYCAARMLGIVALWRFANRNKVTILTFHGVMDSSDGGEWTPLRHRTPVEDFEKCLQWLSSSYNFIDLDTAIEIIAGRSQPIKNALVVTFDDGYKNNFEIALPVLDKLGISATYYLATAHVEHGEPFWFDRLDFALQYAMKKSSKMVINGVSLASKNTAKDNGKAAFLKIRSHLKSIEITEQEFKRKVDDVASELEQIAGCSLDSEDENLWSAIASWSDIRQAIRNKRVTIGSHSVNHTRLSFETPDEVVGEVSESKSRIEAELKRECGHFAYPNGAHNEMTRGKIVEAGYLSAVTSDSGTNSVGDDLFTLKRMYLPTVVEKHELFARVAGLQTVVSRVVTFFCPRRKKSSKYG